MKHWFLLMLSCLLCLVTADAAQAAKPQPKAGKSLSSAALKKIFGSYKGCFLLEQLAPKKRLIAYGGKACQRRHAPCSTFKVPHALIALQTGVVKDPKKPFRWDGKKRWLKVWNRDHSLWTSLRHSVVWVYKRIAPQIGRKRMTGWLKKLRYGDGRVVGDMRSFWLRRSLTISALEQLAFYERLALGTLPFAKRHIRTVKAMMILKQGKRGDVLRGKTGSAFRAGKWKLGWFVGVVAREGRRYVFVAKIRGGRKPMGTTAKRMTYQILKQLKLFPR